LCGQLHIQKIFEEGKGFNAYPFFFNYRFVPQNDSSNYKVVVMVSKKKHKKAIDRNRIKRQCRELFRLNINPIKEVLSDHQEWTMHLGINYISSKKMEFAEMEKAYKVGLKKLCNEINKNFS
jgi:ribonuclease P protein component